MADRRFFTRGNCLKGVFILAMVMFTPWSYKVCRDLWVFYAMELHPPNYAFDSEKPTGINLPLGMALLFKDENGRCGYFYLTKRDRKSIDYCFVLDSPIQAETSEGKIRLWAWVLRQHLPQIIFVAPYSFEKYFFWIPNGAMLFNGNLQKVALVPVENNDHRSIRFNQVNWITPGQPDY